VPFEAVGVPDRVSIPITPSNPVYAVPEGVGDDELPDEAMCSTGAASVSWITADTETRDSPDDAIDDAPFIVPCPFPSVPVAAGWCRRLPPTVTHCVAALWLSDIDVEVWFPVPVRLLYVSKDTAPWPK
jgi:hypothetical protein